MAAAAFLLPRRSISRRIVAGLSLVVWAALGGPALAWLDAVPLAAGLVGFCPFYTLFGFSSCGKDSCDKK